MKIAMDIDGVLALQSVLRPAQVQRIQDLDTLIEYLRTEDCTAEMLSAQRKELIT